jgi:hypothetical protein
LPTLPPRTAATAGKVGRAEDPPFVNVAISRAKQLLVVVASLGDVERTSSLWRRFGEVAGAMGPGLVRRVAVETEEGVEAALDSVLGAGSGAGGADKGETKEDEGRGGGGKTKKRGR